MDSLQPNYQEQPQRQQHQLQNKHPPQEQKKSDDCYLEIKVQFFSHNNIFYIECAK